MSAHPLEPLLAVLREALGLAEEAFAAERTAGRKLDGPALSAQGRATQLARLVADVERQIARESERNQQRTRGGAL